MEHISIDFKGPMEHISIDFKGPMEDIGIDFKGPVEDISIDFKGPMKHINIVNWITMTRKSGEHRTAVSTLLGLISSVIPWSPSLDIEPATSECKTETVPLSHWSTSHTSDVKSTSHGNCMTNQPVCVLQVTSVLFTEDTVTSRTMSSQEHWKYTSR